MKRDKQLSKNFSLREFVEAKDIHPSYYPNFWEALKKNKEHQNSIKVHILLSLTPNFLTVLASLNKSY